MPLSRFIFFIWVLVGVFVSAAGAAEKPDILFKTSPRIELLRPFVDPIDLSILVTGVDGRPVKTGSIDIRLDAPKPGRFFSTDYPFVEGTLLNEMRLQLRQGRASWKYLFPIRGDYRLAVDFTGEEGVKASQVFTFPVRENRQKLWTLAGFSLALAILGFAAGRIFTGTSAGAVLICSLVLSLAGQGHSHGPGQSGPAAAGLEIEPAAVGKAGVVRWKNTDTNGSGAGTALLTLSILHLEKEKTVFGVDKIRVGEDWSMKFHFPDAAAYRVNAVADRPGRPPVRSEQVVAVTGAEPPATASLPALASFVALIAAGLGAGRWSKRRGVGLDAAAR